MISAASGDTIRNIRRMEVDNERCSLLFGPVLEKGTYYFYYLPHRVEEGQGFCDGTYLEPEQPLDVAWQQAAAKQKRPLEAEITSVEARTSYDSFYPMEIIATKAEELEYLKEMFRNPSASFSGGQEISHHHEAEHFFEVACS